MRVTNRKTRVTDDVVKEVREDIEADIRRRHKCFEEARDEFGALVEEFCASDDDFFAITRTLWDALMILGLRAVELIWARRRRAPEKTSVYDAEGTKFRYHKQRGYSLRCIFGQGEVRGSQYIHGKNARSGDRLCPQMSRMGVWSLGDAFGPQLALECAHAASQMPFDTAKEQLERFIPYVPSKRSLLGIVDALAPHAQAVKDSQRCPTGDVIVVQFDGRGMPKISPEEYLKRCRPHQKGDEAPPRRRRNQSQYLDSKTGVGKNKTKTREVSVGIIYALNQTDDGGWEMAGDKQYFARMGDREAVMAQMGRQLDALDDEPDRILFLTDGLPHYETLRDRYLPDKTEHVVDFYHVCEYLWDAGAAIRKKRRKKFGWVGAAKDLLRKGQAEAVITWLEQEYQKLPRRGPGTKDRRKTVEDAIEYIESRTDMMPYDELLDTGLEIGSGAVESAVRQVVALRFDGPGMRWGDDRPNRMLSLVCVRLSRRWNKLETRLRQHVRSSHSKIRRITPIGVAEQRQKDFSACA